MSDSQAAYDIDLLTSVFREYVAMVGHKKAVFAILKIWERAVAKEITTDQL